MDILDDSDPITQLSDQISRSLNGHDGGTVIGALAMSLAVTVMWAERKTDIPSPRLIALREDLIDLIVTIVQTRSAQRES